MISVMTAPPSGRRRVVPVEVDGFEPVAGVAPGAAAAPWTVVAPVGPVAPALGRPAVWAPDRAVVREADREAPSGTVG
ncbi:hypothetical protein GCM10025865_33070 [Paraoerskovia sediminicola]|uniref:Uncharacterized protein n=2 Tax=Paraoerskovia sediminicola TaxID=1138587 RepID=A0ABN6X7Q3_9CELL|nr:hypothetical protein GCM10025865_00380 [Paraoerskovia sediminicola]BDZ44008.1 hypothetical protein GCM10025865_33070 [Paraoerskovia sediminicola]